MNIKPLVIVKARHAAISGGYYRLYEILKNGKSEGINYVIVTDLLSYRNYVQMFPDFKEILSKYRSYIIDFRKIKLLTPRMPRGLKAVTSYWDSFLLATSISRIAREENVDLVVGPSEGSQIVWASYFSGRICHVPWTALFQGTTHLLQPTPGLGPINPINVLKHVRQKESARKTPLISQFGFSIELLGLLKIAEETLILTVSQSMCEEIKSLNPRIKFHIITPGNGINLEKFAEGSRPPLYDALYFSRLVPEKGLFDLPEIWKLVVQRFPKAKLAVAGIVEDFKFVKEFQRMVSRYGLTKNIIFLGPQDKNSIIDLVRSSKLTINPSVLDTFSLVVLESLACGTPNIAYNIPAIKYNFCKCKAVFLCPVKDKASMAKEVVSLLENEDLRNRLSKEAKEYAGNFDWKKVVKAEKEAYFKVVEWFNSHR